MTNNDIFDEIGILKNMVSFMMDDIAEIKEAVLKMSAKKKPSTTKGKTLLCNINVDEAKDMASESDRASVWLYGVLKKYHENKQKFKNAKLEEWSANFDLIFKTHKRNPVQFVNLVKWMIKRGDTGFLQSASFFSKDGGKNYDTFLGIMESEARKNAKTNDNVQFTPKSKK